MALSLKIVQAVQAEIETSVELCIVSPGIANAIKTVSLDGDRKQSCVKIIQMYLFLYQSINLAKKGNPLEQLDSVKFIATALNGSRSPVSSLYA